MLLTGDYHGAIDDQTKAIAIDPDNKEPYYNRGCAKVMIKDFQGALDDFDEALRLDPEYEDVYIERSMLLEMLEGEE